MEFNSEDALKYYELASRVDSACTNIGILGDEHKFKNLYKHFLKNKKEGFKVRLLQGNKFILSKADGADLYTYVLIQNEPQLTGWRFAKYM